MAEPKAPDFPRRLTESNRVRPWVDPVAVNAGSERHVFVYGTLRRGQRNDITRLTPTPRYVSEASVTGQTVHLGAYPGVILSQAKAGQSRIQGEVYAITAALERQLDEIEMIDPQTLDDPESEYVKRDLEVLIGMTRLMCLVYELNPRHAVGRPVIASGDWVQGQ
jgi:gamma-glutamylcyclotransferase (GGCT)/AIG2-like uncharacterized protein YtfP